jgi:Ca2+-binding EF-hand superfamily protein
MMTREVKSKDTEEELRQAFRAFDADDSGTISTSELHHVMKSLGEDLTDEEINDMMRTADLDQSGTIDCMNPPPSPLAACLRAGSNRPSPVEEFVLFMER